MTGSADTSSRVTWTASGRSFQAEAEGFSTRLRVSLPEDLRRFVIPQGSITIEGVSLTVAEAAGDWIEVALIPETKDRTSLSALVPGSPVNVECDVIARYVEKMMSPYGDKIQPTDKIGE